MTWFSCDGCTEDTAILVSLLCALCGGFLCLLFAISTDHSWWRSIPLLRPLFVGHCLIYSTALLLALASVGLQHSDLGMGSKLARGLFGTCIFVCIFATIASNTCVCALLLQQSTGLGAFTRAATHGILHVLLLGGAVVAAVYLFGYTNPQFQQTYAFLTVIALYACRWALYILPVWLADNDGHCSLHNLLPWLDPSQLANRDFQISLFVSWVYDLCAAAAFIWGHSQNASGFIGVSRWVVWAMVAYIAIFPVQLVALSFVWSKKLIKMQRRFTDEIESRDHKVKLSQYALPRQSVLVDYRQLLGRGGESSVYAGTRDIGGQCSEAVAVRVVTLGEMTHDCESFSSYVLATNSFANLMMHLQT